MDVVTSPASGHNRSLLLEAAGQVERLIKAGKCKQAVELAKDEHKRQHTPESEQLVVKAYLARIAQFQQKGAVEDAQTLLKLVRERFPAHRASLADLELHSAAIAGNIDELVAPLARPDIAPDVRAKIEALVRQQVTDLPRLAECRALPAGHPLKTAAAAVWRAFEAVTAGPVEDEQIALPQVSQHSPLAAWKLLVRAIAAFYRGDDAGCGHALAAMPEDAATCRLAPVLTAMIEGKPAGLGLASVLASAVGGDDRPLRKAIDGVEQAFRDSDLFLLRRHIQQALQSCRALYPQLYERVRQHLSARCLLEEVPSDESLRMIGLTTKDAHMWRMLATAIERRGDAPLAALYWERFLRHAVHEGLVRPGSLETGAVYSHMAELLARLSPEELAEVRHILSHSGMLRRYYKGQPPEIQALAPASDRELVEKTLDPNELFGRAAEISPDVQTFQQWWKWASDASLPGNVRQNVALTWHLKRPQDPPPLLHLSLLAEGRGALKLALKYLGEAEAIDPMSPHVRKSRARLTLGRAWQHFKDAKAHLVEKDLDELEKLPAMQEDDRPAFLCALRAAWHALRGDAAAAARAYEAVVQRLGLLAAAIIMDSVARRTGLGGTAAWPQIRVLALPDPRAVLEAETRTIRLALDFALTIWRPVSWNAMIDEVLGQRPCRLSHADLLAIGRAASIRRDSQQAYLASAAGLSLATGPAAGRFLVLRARNLPRRASQRISQCLRAARELAQQAHDADLMREVSEQIDAHADVRLQLSRAGGDGGLNSELLADILRAEREAETPPRDPAAAERHVVAIESEARWHGLLPDDEEDYAEDVLDEDEEGDEFQPEPDELPPELEREMQKILKEYGRIPDVDVLKRNPRLVKRLLQAMFEHGFDSEMPIPDGRRGGRRRRRP